MRHRSLAHRLLFLPFLSVTLAACTDTGPAAPDATDATIAADLGVMGGDVIAGEVGSLFADVAASGSGGPPRAGDPPRPACSYDAASGWHDCSVNREHGLTVERRFRFLTSTGEPMARYDESATGSIEFAASIDGSRAADGVTAARHHERTAVVSGLAGAETERLWNGSASTSDTVTHVGERGTRRYTGTGTTRVTDVLMALPINEHLWPMSGTVEHTMRKRMEATGARTVTRDVAGSATVTFNGTATVPLVTGTRQCTLHLDTRRVTDCSP